MGKEVISRGPGYPGAGGVDDHADDHADPTFTNGAIRVDRCEDSFSRYSWTEPRCTEGGDTIPGNRSDKDRLVRLRPLRLATPGGARHLLFVAAARAECSGA
jgi:hypothetical protein